MDLSVVNWLSDWVTKFLSVRYFKVWRDHSIIQLTGFHCFIFFFFPLVSDIAFWMSVCGAGLLGRSIRPTVRAHHHPRSGHVLWNIIQGCDICNSRLCICDLGLPRYCRSHITGLDAFKLGSHPTFFMNTSVFFLSNTQFRFMSAVLDGVLWSPCWAQLISVLAFMKIQMYHTRWGWGSGNSKSPRNGPE